jgi:hypothetical protein
VLTLLTGPLSASLALLKVGMLGYVAVNVVSPYQAALEGLGLGFVNSGFFGWDGLFGVCGFSKVVQGGANM